MLLPATEHRKLAAIMFTDRVDYSALAQRNEVLALELLEERRRVVRDILPKHRGREVKTTGDTFRRPGPFDVSADEQRFLMMHVAPDENAATSEFATTALLIENWFEEFRQKK